MVTVDYLPLFNGSIPSGDSVQSTPVSCADARSVQVTLATGPLSDEVEWRVLFGPLPAGGGFTAARSGTFERHHHLGIEVTVFGPQVMVAVENHTAGPFPIAGAIRIAHDLA